MSEAAVDKKSVLLAFKAQEVTETVRIGPVKCVIKKIIDPGVLQLVPTEADGRKGIAIDVDGKKVHLTEDERHAYTWLFHALVEPKLDFAEIVRVSRETGLDCLNAGKRAVLLTGLASEEIDKAKND